MDRAEILQKIIDSSELNRLRALIKNTESLQQKVFKGWRPQVLTKEVIKQKLLRTAFVNDDGIFEMFCDWWKSIHVDMIDELHKGIEDGWESIISRWPVSKVRLALVLGEFDDKETLKSELLEAEFYEFMNVQNQNSADSVAVKQRDEKGTLTSIKDKYTGEQFSNAVKKNQTLSKQNTSLSGD